MSRSRATRSDATRSDATRSGATRSDATRSGKKDPPGLEVDGDRLIVSGCLDVETVADCRDDGEAFFESVIGPAVSVDLSRAEVTGSAAIALLIGWQRAARERGLELTLTGASPKLLEIADACGVRAILRFSEATA